MSLLPRNLFPSIAQELNRAFSLLDEPLLTVGRRFPASFPTLSNNLSFRPSVDISETSKSYIVEAEVPGMKKDDLSVEWLDDNTLILKGKIERSRGDEDSEPLRTVDATTGKAATSDSASDQTASDITVGQPTTYWSSERIVGNFSRSFQFPGRVNPDNVKATYKDGILSIVVPKVERHGKQINIE